MDISIMVNKFKKDIISKFKRIILKLNKELIRNSYKKEVTINMEKEKFSGDLLDIESENYGIIYNIYKNANDEFNISYMDHNNKIEKKSYDVCIMFLCFSSIIFKVNRRKILNKIYDSLKENGSIYILDVDKGYGKVYNKTVRFVLPNSQEKEVNIKEYNIFKDSSKESTCNLLGDYFDIINNECAESIYYIKAQKKRSVKDEQFKSIIGGNKL